MQAIAEDEAAGAVFLAVVAVVADGVAAAAAGALVGLAVEAALQGGRVARDVQHAGVAHSAF